jgi:regulator of protease activity HflC (stomatin/prohibitin superfamily)
MDHIQPLVMTALNPFRIFSPSTMVPIIAVIAFAISGVVYMKKFLKFVSMDEQLFVESLTNQTVVDGPQVVCLNPFTTKQCEVRKALSLGPLEYCIIKNILSGEQYIQVGPKMVLLRAYDRIKKDTRTGGEKRKALSLKANEYVRFIDNKTGKVRVLHGEMGCVVPSVDEEFLDVGGKRKALDLKIFEYVKIQNKKTGELRTERGEKLVFLGPFDELLGKTKEAIEVDDETAVLVRNKRSGQQNLVTKKMLFIPSNDEEVAEVRKLMKLAEYEACIVRGKTGKDLFYFGSNEHQRSFFLPPHSQLVELLWSRGRRREYRDLRISKLDLRPMYMSFEFNCRTNDNVELVLEGSFFWEVVDLESMVKFTNDTTGDICNHARSRFIELVSQVTLQDFMTQFNTIAKKVHEADETGFYKQRGVKIHSLEVTGYHCAENSTAQILEQIIQETTNRMNRLQQQESQNEVQLQEIRGDIEEEKARQELIEIQTMNSNAKSKMEGMAEAEKVKSFIDQLKGDFPDMGMQTQISLWNTLRKEDALRVISEGNANLYFTPADVNLSIETHEHLNKKS